MDQIAIFLAWMFDGIFKAIGAGFTLLFGLPLPGIVAVIATLALLGWRVSIVFGPKKDCNRCGASGARRGPLGGRKVCARCDGSGLRDRIGAKK